MHNVRSVSATNEVPVFPLPNVVFFPKVVLPLHVFETRYRELVRDATDGEGLIAISLLHEGFEENYEGSPPFHSIGTVGKIEELNVLDDGRMLLRLVGLQRVELNKVVQERPYRRVQMRPLGETPVEESSDEVQSAKLELLASQSALLRELRRGPGESFVMDDRVPFEAAVNSACAHLPIDPAIRQSLLEENELVVRQQRASSLLDQALERVLQLKAMRSDHPSSKADLN